MELGSGQHLEELLGEYEGLSRNSWTLGSLQGGSEGSEEHVIRRLRKFSNTITGSYMKIENVPKWLKVENVSNWVI